jgi:hypothetical protein
MFRTILIKAAGVVGILIILYAYYLFWIPEGIELQEVIIRTRIAIILNLVGNLMVVFYLYKRTE